MIKSLLVRVRGSAFKICCFGPFAFVFAATVAVQPVAAQDYAVLHTFVPAEGIVYEPTQVLQGADGMLYGIAQGNGGSLFRLNPDGSNLVALYSFNGYAPSGLIQGQDGRLYGTTALGAAGDRYVYGVNTDGSNFVVLHSFSFYQDGAGPYGLIHGADGRLYGSTSEGGPFNAVGSNIGCGTIYALNVDGSSSQRIADSSPRPKLEAFLRESAAEGEDEPLDLKRHGFYPRGYFELGADVDRDFE
jgi:hypothetical protein